MADLRKLIADVVAPLRSRVMLTVGRCVLAATEDATRAQTLQVKGLRGEVLSEVEQIIAYGLTSRVLDPDAAGEAEGIMVCVGGNRDHAVVIATEDRRHRPRGKLSKGEVMLYDDQGTKIHLERGQRLLLEVAAGAPAGECEIFAGTVRINADQVVINAPNGTQVVGDLVVTGSVTDGAGGGGTMDGMRDTYNIHTHTDPQGGTTGPANPQA